MKRVYVGLSGGVDSAVSAALLKESGYDVTGVFIKIWQPEFIECTWREDRLDAMRIAAFLDVPFREIDLSGAYKEAVIDSMLGAYAVGQTPNPDVLCNEKIKFGSFFDWAIAEGAEYVATGHYARTENGMLLRGKDASKDQSYFLHRISEQQLLRTRFPVGEMDKIEVRAYAERLGLPVSKKPDSQGLCFVGDITLPEFLSRFVESAPGAVLDTAGKKIGTHPGALFFTIGQRHGFCVEDSSVYYVTAIDTAENTITVSDSIEDTRRNDASLADIHWIGKAPTLPLTADAQARYREQPVPVVLEQRESHVTARFDAPHLCSPGQSLVIYQGDRCLGGGIIAAA